MNITIATENCTSENFYIIEELADSSVKLTITYPKIVTVQSRKILIDQVINQIQAELKKFKWLICGPVRLDLGWYLNAIERQETDAIGDIDNITKPIQDALCGPDGLLVDDSQIGALYTYWMTRNDLLTDNVLVMNLKFSNDDTLMKKNLFFIQYYQAICLPVNVDSTKVTDMIAANIIIKNRLGYRKLADKIREAGGNADIHLVQSNYDFHRTRLNGFSAQITSLAQLKQKCKAAGLTLSDYFNFFRKKTSKPD